MSNTIRYDALLTRHLARELAATLRTERLLSVHFDRDRGECRIAFADCALLWSIQRGPNIERPPLPGEGHLLSIPKKAAIERIEAVPDERILRIDFSGGSRANGVRSIVIELLPPEPDLIALDDEGRVLKSLVRAASRPQTRGQPYAPPPTRGRRGSEDAIALDEWLELLRDVAPAERTGIVIRSVAYLSPINADAVLASAATPAEDRELVAAHERYMELLGSPMRPVVIPLGKRLQPYGHALWQTAALPQPSLLAAIAHALEGDATDTSPVARLETALQRERKKRERLLQESERAGEEAVQLRAAADLVLANAGSIKRGAREIELQGFDGEPKRLELDPALSAAENAEVWYTEARKRERAAERVPQLVRETDRVIAGIEDKLKRAMAGEAIEMPARAAPGARKQPTIKVPYRRYRTSGGLEVRVGRSSRDNDELTFKHSSPNDLWMHARAVGGAHVVLRWTDADNQPPAADLREAAVLAAVHSKARHAGTVPIDWTRRKYVRKSRGSPAGQVLVERSKTLFVAPDDALEKRLQWPLESI
ncbi:MAG: NFACT family protein [Gemmatimonadota bacterium]